MGHHKYAPKEELELGGNHFLNTISPNQASSPKYPDYKKILQNNGYFKANEKIKEGQSIL